MIIGKQFACHPMALPFGPDRTATIIKTNNGGTFMSTIKTIIDWHITLTLAQEASKATQKPILLDFFNPG